MTSQADVFVSIRGYLHHIRGFSRNIRLYLACTVFRALTMGLSTLLLNLYLLSMGFDAAFIGLNNALLSLSTLGFSVPAGLVADRIGRKRAMLIGLAGMAVAQFGLALSLNGGLILASNVLSGAVGSLFLTSIAPFLSENARPRDRAVLFTLDSGLMNLSSFVASAVGGYLPRLFAALWNVGPESARAYQGALLVAAFTLLLALGAIVGLEERAQPVSALPRGRAYLRIWRRFSNPQLLGKLVLPRVLIGFGAGLIFPFLNLFYKQRFGVSDATLGWIFGITNVLAAVVMVVSGAFAERLGKVRALLIARTISTPILLVMGFVPSLPVVVAAHWIRSGLMRLGEPLYIAFAMEQLATEERATGSGLLSMGWNVGWSAGPYVSGLVQVYTGFGPLFVSTVLLYTLSLVSVYWFFVRHQAPRRG